MDVELRAGADGLGTHVASIAVRSSQRREYGSRISQSTIFATHHQRGVKAVHMDYRRVATLLRAVGSALLVVVAARPTYVRKDGVIASLASLGP